MQFDYSAQFTKQWIKTSKKIQARAEERLQLFCDYEFSPILGNHKLSGEYSGYRSINVTGDWRIIYQRIDTETIFLYAIGTHSQLYG